MQPPRERPSVSRRTVVKSGTALAALTLSGGFSWRGAPRVLEEGDKILVNQSGYGANLPKGATALVKTPKNRSRISFALHNVTSNKVVDKIEAVPSAVHKLDGHSLTTIDFSDTQTPGRYVLSSGDISSAPFEISEDPYRDLIATLGRAFYLQRCGIGLLDDVTGLGHATCHNYDAELAHGDFVNEKGRLINVVGGWHDAGDYGKYVATTALTVGELLSTYLRHPGLFSDGDWKIPESGNGEPDVLSEMKVGLFWLLSMQRSDGALYRKVAGKEWPEMDIPPEHDSQVRFIFGISTSDTAMAAAAFEIGARAYADWDQSLAVECSEAADRAWKFLEDNPQPQLDRRWGDEDGSGAYFLNEQAQQRVDEAARDWALAERAINRPEVKLTDRLERRIIRQTLHPISWDRPTSIGLFNVVAQAELTHLSGAARLIRTKLRQTSNYRLRVASITAFGLANPDFIWGFNRATSQSGVLLALAGRELGNRDMTMAAAKQADFVLGVNPFDKSFVTGMGARSINNVHHRLALATGRKVPGLLVGGPNENVESGIAAPGKGVLSYVDDERSFATNEFAIDHNSALIILLTELRSANAETTEKASWLDRLLDLWPW